MIKTQSIANLLETQLNALLAANKFKFKIFGNTGDYVDKDKIIDPKNIVYGVVIPSPGSSIVPVKGLDNLFMQFNASLIMKAEFANNVHDIINKYIENNIGVAGVMDEYAYIVNFDVPTVGSRNIVARFGDSVEMYFTMSYQFIKNGLLSNDTIVTINGETMFVLESNLIKVKIGQTENPLDEGKDMYTIPTQQGLTLKLVVPYVKSPQTNALAKDIADGMASTKYAIVYSDGNITTTYSMILQDGAINNKALATQTISATFVITRAAV